MPRPAVALLAALVALATAPAGAAPAPSISFAEAQREDQKAFRALFRDLVETDSSITTGSCTAVADKVEAHLRAAGFDSSRITRFAPPDRPQDGGIVAVLPGTSKATGKAGPILLLGHLDVVTARREEWTRDPYKLVEEGGYFYARGAADMKGLDAIWVDTMIRLKQRKTPPRRTLKLALTCGEETSGAFNGAQWLTRNRRDLIDAAFALNEGGAGRTNGTPIAKGGHLEAQAVQVGEKAYQDYTLTVTNPGGHSSLPVPDNAITTLAEALVKIRAYEFPMGFNPTTLAYFRKVGAVRKDDTGAAMVKLAANPADPVAAAIVNRDKLLHALLHTTCVATMVSAGHALNALPQTATANVNCRILPGETSESTQTALVNVVANPAVAIVPRVTDKPIAMMPPLDAAVIGPMDRLEARYFPQVPLVPLMSTGASDGVYLSVAGIPTYGVPGIWLDPDNNGMHGLNERVEVAALMTARDYLFDLVGAYVN